MGLDAKQRARLALSQVACVDAEAPQPQGEASAARAHPARSQLAGLEGVDEEVLRDLVLELHQENRRFWNRLQARNDALAKLLDVEKEARLACNCYYRRGPSEHNTDVEQQSAFMRHMGQLDAKLGGANASTTARPVAIGSAFEARVRKENNTSFALRAIAGSCSNLLALCLAWWAHALTSMGAERSLARAEELLAQQQP